MKTVTMTFQFDVEDEQALREHFAKQFIPPEDAKDCGLGYFALCAIEDEFKKIPGLKLRLDNPKWDK